MKRKLQLLSGIAVLTLGLAGPRARCRQSQHCAHGDDPGIIDFGLIDPRTRPEIYSGKVTIMGRGKLCDKKCAISGTIKIKFTTPAV